MHHVIILSKESLRTYFEFSLPFCVELMSTGNCLDQLLEIFSWEKTNHVVCKVKPGRCLTSFGLILKMTSICLSISYG